MEKTGMSSKSRAKPKEVHAQVYQELYSCKIYLRVGEDLWKMRCELNEELGEVSDQDETEEYLWETAEAITSFAPDKRYGMFFRTSAFAHGTITHEAYHVCTHIMECIGGCHKSDSDEPHAYLIGWLVDWVYRNTPHVEKIIYPYD